MKKLPDTEIINNQIVDDVQRNVLREIDACMAGR